MASSARKPPPGVAGLGSCRSCSSGRGRPSRRRAKARSAAGSTITIRIEDPDHPVNAAFAGQSFEICDEVFQFRHGYSRDKLRILLAIDPDRTDMGPNRRILPERRKDKDLAMSWVRGYGQGRVFYTSFGHNKEIFWNGPILRHIFDGIQFALGDLAASTTPSNQLASAEPAR